MPRFQTQAHTDAEERVFDVLAAKWQCEVHRFPQKHHIDGYCCRDERITACVELKVRSHALGTYPTVFLSHRKFHWLTLHEASLGAPGVFLAGWSCGAIRWCVASELPRCESKVTGHTVPRPGSAHDQEHMLLVPIHHMKDL